MAMNKKVSLLGIPPELRLQIYEILLDDNLQQPANGRWPFLYKSSQHSHIRLTIPWVALTRTCKTTSSELHSLLQKRRISDHSHNTTYTIDINPEPPHGFYLRSLSWRHIPCPPHQATTLIANILTDKEVHFHGNGGPSSLTVKLFEALNRFMHCGPLMSFETPLRSQMKLQKLIVNVPATRPREPYPDTYPDIVVQVFVNQMEQLAKIGFLVGLVDVLRFEQGEWSQEWTVEGQDLDLETEWRRYGFGWMRGSE